MTGFQIMNASSCSSFKIRVVLFMVLLGAAAFHPAYAAKDQIVDSDTVYDMDIYQLMNLEVVTATKTNIKVKDSPSAVYVITEKEIRERGYRTLSDALEDVPGFDFQHTYGLFPDLIHQRGFVGNNQRSLVYINGIPDNNISENAVLGGTIRYPLFNAERIEIVSGPVSALYGANAFNGVINIITKDGTEKSEKKAEGFMGSWMDNDYLGGGATFAVNDRCKVDTGQMVYGVSGYYYNATGPDFRGVQKLDENGNGYWWSDTYNNSNEDTYNLTAKIHGEHLRIEAMQWQYLQGDGTSANGTSQIDTDGHGFSGSSWDFRNSVFSVGYLTDISPAFKLDSEITARQTEVLSSSHESYPDIPGPDAYNHPNDITMGPGYSRPDYGYELKENLNWKPDKKLENTFGMEAAYYSVPEGYDAYQRFDFKNYAAYVQSIYRMTDIVSLVGGYRFDHNTSYEDAHTYRISVIGNPGDLTLKALFSTGFSAPTPWEMLDATRQREKNLDLNPEKLWSAETGVGYSFSHRGHISLSAYYNVIKDIILEVQTTELNPNPESQFWNQNQNIGKAEVVGLEFDSDFMLTDTLTLFFNYTFSDGDYHDLPETLISPPTAHDGNSIPDIPQHKANVGFTYSLLRDLTLNLRANYVGDRDTIQTDPVKKVDQYILCHANIRWENVFTKGLYFQLLVRNLFNTKAFDPGIRTATGGYYPTEQPIEGRNVWFTVGYKF